MQEDIRIKLGKIVSSENEDNWWRRDLFKQNTAKKIPKEIEILELPPEEEKNYNCFVYVLGLQNDERFMGNKGWEFTRNLGSVFIEMIQRGTLKPVKTPQKGDMAIYRLDTGAISHVGLMENENEVISKWSWGPLLKHALWAVPDHYGNVVEFYQVSKEARDFVIEKYERQIISLK